VRNRGQAAIEYVAILLVVVAALVVATVAVPGVGERVVAAVRTGVCIVGGDLCRSADAAAAGLDPCVTSARSTREDTTLDIAVVRLGENGEWELAVQSDGAAIVTRLDEQEAGGTIGVGVSFTPLGIEAQATAAMMAGYHGGRAWRFADARTAGAFLERAIEDRSALNGRRADVRWHAFAGHTDGDAEIAIAGLARAGLSASLRNAIGLRTDGPRRTLSLEYGIDDPRFAADLPGFPAAAGKSRSWVVDVAWEDGGVRELTLRTAVGNAERLEEIAGRLDLRDPGNRAVAERLLRPGPATLAALRTVAARIGTHGVVELSRYRVSEQRLGFSVASRLGISLGVAHQRVSSERRLTDAVAWVRGGPPQRRFDCLGV
jgi:hypothetical protein